MLECVIRLAHAGARLGLHGPSTSAISCTFRSLSAVLVPIYCYFRGEWLLWLSYEAIGSNRLAADIYHQGLFQGPVRDTVAAYPTGLDFGLISLKRIYHVKTISNAYAWPYLVHHNPNFLAALLWYWNNSEHLQADKPAMDSDPFSANATSRMSSDFCSAITISPLEQSLHNVSHLERRNSF